MAPEGIVGLAGDWRGADRAAKRVVRRLGDAGIRMTTALLGVQPRLLAHGHFHVCDRATVRLPGADYNTSLVSLSMAGEPGNVALLNLATLEVEVTSW